MAHVLVVHGDKETSRAVASTISGAFEVSRSPDVADATALVAAGHRYDAILCAPELLEDLSKRLLASSFSQMLRVLPFQYGDRLVAGTAGLPRSMLEGAARALEGELHALTVCSMALAA